MSEMIVFTIFIVVIVSLFWVTMASAIVQKWHKLAMEYEQENIRRVGIMNRCGRCAAEWAKLSKGKQSE